MRHKIFAICTHLLKNQVNYCRLTPGSPGHPQPQTPPLLGPPSPHIGLQAVLPTGGDPRS